MEPPEVLLGLLDQKVVTILRLFLKDDSKQYYLREISKATKVSLGSTHRILNRLVNSQILKVTEIKTAKIYSLEPNRTVEYLKTLIEVDCVAQFVEIAKNLAGVDEILLLAKDKTKANVLILGTLDSTELRKISWELKEKYQFTINHMSLTKEQYDQMSSMGLYPGTKKSLFRKN
ncbi:MAG: helix-turn-helix domain-containing protein [Nanoarchaeota archaeon]|nr:helix-turn-helix domain-containing protein [Nanoarchaeota archaeon]